ncbi:MAG: hypothetical protein ABIJ86_11405 [Spirochaetota bacterium]
MNELSAQIRNGIPYPASDTDREVILDNYKQNQLVKVRIYGIRKELEPSVIQSNLLHACIKLVADNHPKWKTADQVKFMVKVALHFVYEDRIAVRPDGTVQFAYRSFCFAELRNMERLRIFERAFDFLAESIGLTVEELIAKAKSLMRTY